MISLKKLSLFLALNCFYLISDPRLSPDNWEDVFGDSKLTTEGITRGKSILPGNPKNIKAIDLAALLQSKDVVARVVVQCDVSEKSDIFDVLSYPGILGLDSDQAKKMNKFIQNGKYRPIGSFISPLKGNPKCTLLVKFKNKSKGKLDAAGRDERRKKEAAKKEAKKLMGHKTYNEIEALLKRADILGVII